MGIVEPVELAGTTVTRVSLHNYGALRKGNCDIRIGSKVIIAKKGDIIPQIVKVTSVGQFVAKIPTECPSCGEGLNWTYNSEGEKVDLICENYNCLAQLVAKIDNWFKKIGVKGIGKSTIAKLTDPEVLKWEGHAIIESLPEMYYMLDNDRRSDHPATGTPGLVSGKRAGFRDHTGQLVDPGGCWGFPDRQSAGRQNRSGGVAGTRPHRPGRHRRPQWRRGNS